MKLSKKAIKLLGATIASAMLIPGTIVYATSGDGLYNTFSSIYGTAASSATDAIGSAIQSVIPDVVSSGGSSSGGSNGGSQINGIPVITYYPIGHEVTETTPTTTTTITGNSSTSTQVTQGSTSSRFVQDIAPLESNPIGPSVNAVSLSESYHENYQVYEERLDDIYAIYTNIAAGTITNRPVIFDVPTGVIVRMTRDGKEVAFKNKEKIEKEGTYVTYFYVEKDSIEQMPAWAQTVDRATFSFRIQYTALDGTKLDAQEVSELESFADTVNETQQTTTVEEPRTTEEPKEEEKPEEKEEEKKFEGVVTNTNALNCEYDSSTGYYKNTLLTGDSFYSNIPNGMITNRSVLFNTTDKIRYELYKNGESIEYKAGDYIKEDGAYVLIPVIDNIEYEGYYRTTRPMVRFRILNGPTSEMATMSAPFGMSVNAVRFNGENVTDAALISPNVISMPEDGNWEVDLFDGGGSVTTKITRDTKAPVVTVVSQPNLAEITYGDQDEVSEVILTRGEEVVSEGVLISKVTNAGRYVLKVTDRAGNTSVKEFSVQYRINAYAVLAIIMVIAIALGVIILLRRAQTKVRVR